MFLFVFLIAEIVAYAGAGIVNGSLFSWSDYQDRRLQVVQEYERQRPKVKQSETKSEKRWRREVIHPYLGYVLDSPNEECSEYGYCDWRIVGKKNAPVTPRSNDNFVVGVFGGSFAYITSTESTRGLFEQELRKIPQLKDKNIIIHTIAMGGYKQPQQLMALNYFLSLGAHFDIVVNIDGFNEVALPPSENLPKQVFPSFPRQWFRRVGKVNHPEALSIVGRIALFQSDRAKLARRIAKSAWRYSVIANLVWEYYDRRYLRRRHLKEAEYSRYQIVSKQRARYVAHGPSFSYTTENDIYQHLARVWSRSSYQMAALSRGLGIHYLHFLQPNQYVKGSKPMTREEREAAILDGHPYQRGVELGYPLLTREGKWLRHQGVNFHDLTMMFADNIEVLYFDQCCHLNSRGHDLMIERIMQEIRAIVSQD